MWQALESCQKRASEQAHEGLSMFGWPLGMPMGDFLEAELGKYTLNRAGSFYGPGLELNIKEKAN